jgi:hypothetical protein
MAFGMITRKEPIQVLEKKETLSKPQITLTKQEKKKMCERVKLD